MALNCNLTRNLLKSTTCAYSLPEITDIYLANFNDVLLADVGQGSGSCSADVVTAITMDSGATFYHIEPMKNSVDFTDELVVGDSGNKYRTHTLTFSTPGAYDDCMHMDFDALSLGRFIGVVKTADNQYLMLGRVAGLEASAATLAGGQNSNGVSITLTANATESAVPLQANVINTVIGTN